jgi:hypothetical protein
VLRPSSPWVTVSPCSDNGLNGCGVQAHAAEVEALREESVVLRRVIYEKDEKLLSEKYRYMELEKEVGAVDRPRGMWRSAVIRTLQRGYLCL